MVPNTNKLSIPNPLTYNINPKTGFLPSPPPLRRLPLYFEPWEILMDHLNILILSGKLREKIPNLSMLDTEKLTSKHEERRAFIVLTFLAHSYMYGVPNADPIISILPMNLAVPWFKVAGKLNINPVVSYSSTALWNWCLIDDSGPFELCNLGSLHTFSGSYDESWFYLVPLSIELAGAPAISAVLSAQKAVLELDSVKIGLCLEIVANCIENMAALLRRMYERCDPAVFWKRIRHYSGGSKNSELFPDGVFYEGILEIDKFVNTIIENPKGLNGTWRKYPGASAGQSPIIHTLDVALSIQHKPLHVHGYLASSPVYVNPMIEMRESLPYEFQQFIKALDLAPSIRDYCMTLESSEKAVFEFNRTCENLKIFRDLHIQIATQYIILQKKSDSAIGTGGTDLVPFLKQVRKETEDAVIVL